MMRTLARIVVACLLALTTAPLHAEDAKPLKIFVLAGQSNMVGKGHTSKLPDKYKTPPKNALMVTRSQSMVPLRYRNSFGPEVSFAHAMAEAYPNETIVIVKHAVGGTSALAWAPDWKESAARLTKNHKQGPLYSELVKMVKPIAERPKAEVVAVLWAQGGRDARFPEAAADYKANLQKIIAAIRKDLGNVEVPFILAQTVAAPKDKFPSIEVVRKAQEAVAKEAPRTKIVSSAGLDTHDDDVHFNAAGQVELGNRFAAAVLEMQRGNTTQTKASGRKEFTKI